MTDHAREAADKYHAGCHSFPTKDEAAAHLATYIQPAIDAATADLVKTARGFEVECDAKHAEIARLETVNTLLAERVTKQRGEIEDLQRALKASHRIACEQYDKRDAEIAKLERVIEDKRIVIEATKLKLAEDRRRIATLDRGGPHTHPEVKET